MLQKAYSESAIAELTGVDRRVVKRRIASVTPCGKTGHGLLYPAPECFQVAFDHTSDCHEAEARLVWVEAEQKTLQLLTTALEVIPEAQLSAALSICMNLLLEDLPEDKADPIANALLDRIFTLDETAKEKRQGEWERHREKLFGPRVKAPQEPAPEVWPDPEN